MLRLCDRYYYVISKQASPDVGAVRDQGLTLSARLRSSVTPSSRTSISPTVDCVALTFLFFKKTTTATHQKLISHGSFSLHFFLKPHFTHAAKFSTRLVWSQVKVDSDGRKLWLYCEKVTNPRLKLSKWRHGEYRQRQEVDGALRAPGLPHHKEENQDWQSG